MKHTIKDTLKTSEVS